MKFIEQIAKSASMPKTGLFAKLGVFLHGQGSSATARSSVTARSSALVRSLIVVRLLFVVPVLVFCVVFGFSAAAARAEAPKLISYGDFGSVTPYPTGVAVDQSTGDVYVTGYYDESGSPIDKFNATGESLSPSPFGEDFNAGAAVDPTNGDLDVFNFFGSIDTYDPNSGALVGTPFPVTVAGEVGPGRLLQIATDAAGDVYVPEPLRETGSGTVPGDEIDEYSPSGTLLKAFTGSGAGTLKEPTGVAVDSSGDLWVADYGNNRIEELSSADAPVGEIKSEGVRSVAIDGHDILALVNNGADFCGSISPPCPHLLEYNPAGVQVADIGAGTFQTGEGFPFTPMIAVNESSGRVYVSDTSNKLVWVFGPPKAPTVERELSAEVGTSEVKLGALVNPGGIETSYRFEYGSTTAYGQSVPFPEGSVGEGLSSRTVWAAASGLVPGASYHYRVAATSELGTVFGPDQTFTTQTAEQAACTNEQSRGGFSSKLPDCRAYELVTASTKTGTSAKLGEEVATDGSAVSFQTEYDPLPGSPSGGRYYVATRGAGGWSSEDVIPLESYTGAVCNGYTISVWAYSDELSKVLLSDGEDTRASEPGGSGLEKQECNAEGLQVVSGEPVGYRNLLLRDNESGAYRLVNTLEPGLTSVPADASFIGASADLSHVVFSEDSALTSNAPAGVQDLYEWDEGALRLLTVLPDGAPTSGSLAEGVGGGSYAISADGSHIVFTTGNLYVRIDGERTVQVDESQGGSGSSGGGSFQAATSDGSKIFFLDESKLTADSTAQAGEPDLYECALPEGATRCELSDLTVATAGEHADVQHVSVLGSADSSYVYFLAKGVLASNSREYENAEGKTVIEKAENGQSNLYVWHGGTTTFIAMLASAYDSGVGQTSPDGTWFAFDSAKSLTGYDNSPSGVPSEEVFLYSASSKQLVCASCDPTGEPPTTYRGGAHIQVGTSIVKHYLSDGGRLFFETPEALVPSDTNGQVDVYEYEDGHLYLISSGTSSSQSEFLGASENGNDVFFLSNQQLVPQDTNAGVEVIYDARVDGGFPPSVSPPPCSTADSCRTPVSPQPSIYGAPSSQTFSGAGNIAPPSEVKPKAKPKSKPLQCKKGFVKKNGRCVKKSEKKPKRKAKKSAHTDRRGK